MSPVAVRRKVEAWLADGGDPQPAIALRARPEWIDEPVMKIGGTLVRVVACPSPLAMRAALHDRAEGERLVLLTELTDAELGDGLLVHLSHYTVRSVDPWELVRQMFGADDIDPSLVDKRSGGGRWVADAVTEYAPPQGWPRPAGTVLTREHALRSLTANLLGLDGNEIDSAGLLQWSTDAAALMRFMNVPDQVAAGIAGFAAETAGPAGRVIIAAVRAGHGIDAIPLGLLCGVLWTTPATQAAVARTRLEPRFGGLQLTDVEAGHLAAAAEAWILRIAESHQREVEPLLRRAETIAAEIDAAALLGGSTLLPAGFTHRMREFAGVLSMGLPDAGPVPVGAVVAAQRALRAVEEHRSAPPVRLETARMAIRLMRWLSINDGAAPATLYDALHRQVRVDGWVDRARLDIFAGDVDPHVADVYQRLHQRVNAVRARHDEQFATLVAHATSAEADPGALLRVEDVLERLVRPVLASGRRVLLLVMDGMSVAAMTELAESLTSAGPWLELTPAGGQRDGVLAALPTVTEVSRCSLLSGAIARGGQAEERKALTARFPGSVLLHKGRLRAGAGYALDPEVRAAIEDRTVPLVAAVINTIDDALDRSDPGLVVWDTDSIPALRDLLSVAQDRVVILTSDHGHVVDRGPDAAHRPTSSSENRWRSADQPSGAGEILVRGSRVGTPDHQAVLPWREELRYGPRKAGYHGGISAAEAVIPLLVLSAGDDSAVPGWSGAPVASPDWWREPLAATPPAEAPISQATRHTVRKPARQTETLFEVEAAPPMLAWPVASPADTGSPLIAALLASPVYVSRRGSRTDLPEERVAALVNALVAAPGGRLRKDTLAANAGVPAHRIGPTLAALRRLLQVEGYPVLDVDPDGQTVILDEQLLREQFGLGSQP
ncbi:BREX-2 system phosphatase PglZ [Catellatospora sp. NPDC049111]|uniref:BREX-2 system phosphatase PglZ n=1 Tax=Catellatospora sp. NPDC049111 TaxID=3155271 RepID=UPI0033D4371B